ncbi:MAG: flavodoxin family protein [Desulfovibrio sp.]|nr:flavodoxin family protein [Desulfovibrio sp.]
MKKVLVISTSLRPGSNSDLLAEAFARGAAEAGHEVEKVSLRGKKIGFCTGCLACQKTQACVIHDDAPEIVQKMKTSDVVAFATPVYYYELSGQLKTLLDRANPLFPSDYAFRDIYLLASAADDSERAVDGALHGLELWVSCFEKCRVAGVLRGVGVTAPGDVRAKPALLEAARNMGKHL